MASPNQTPGGFKFTPLVTSQIWRANQHEPACFGLSSPWFFPSRSGILLHLMPESSPGFLSGDPFRHETSRHLFRRPAPFPLVLGYSRPLVGVDAESSEVIQEKPHPLFFLAPHAVRVPHQFSKHHALWQSCILRACHKSREQDPLLAYSRLDALTSRLDKRVSIGNRVDGAIVLSPTDAASQQAVVGSAQHVVVACSRGSWDEVLEHCLEYLASEHPDFHLEGSAWSVVQ